MGEGVLGDWGFWLVAAALSLAVASSMMAVLFRQRDAEPATNAYDLQVYRAQLAEVDRDVASGALAGSEAERLRAEISRRILEADRLGRGARASSTSSSDQAIASLVIAVALVAAVWGYLRLGASGYPDVPLAGRLATAEAFRVARPAQAEAEAAAPKPEVLVPDAAMAGLMVKLRQAVAARPGDVEGLQLLARNEAALGDLSAATAAQTALIAAKGADVTAADHALLADLLIRLAAGYVSPEAEAALIAALRLEPTNGPALYYSGLMFAQGDRADRAFTIWRDLLSISAPDDPWVAPVQAQIGDVAARAGERYEPPASAGPSSADVEAAAAMPDADRLAMIRSMVDGLSDRLATQGGPVEDWARLITSLGVLGDSEQARAIYTEAQGSFAGRMAELETLKAAAIAAGVAE